MGGADLAGEEEEREGVGLGAERVEEVQAG